MSSRRTVILIVAVAVSGIAAFGLWNYIRNLEGSVYDNAAPEQVWVVRDTVPMGTPIDQAIAQQLISEREMPSAYKPATAVEDPATQFAGLVAVTDLPANQVLVLGNFVPSTVVNTGITDRLEERGMVTVTFSVDQVRGVAYQVVPGDYVNLLALRSQETVDPATGTAIAVNPDYAYTARYVYQRAEVLAVDTALTPDLGETAAAEGATEDAAATTPTAINGGMITLAVPPDAVQTILSVGMENIYLSLVPDSYQPAPLPPIDLGGSVYPGENGGQLTPYGPEPAAEGAQ
ncbi:MAG: Flp pilus assembly protein CpaB [Acidimicrobiales bacterium]